jgi:hypothetical protein
MASRQLNLRFDEQQHDVVRRVVDRLRNDSSFLGALEALLASGIDPAGDQHGVLGSNPRNFQSLIKSMT